MRTSSIVIMDQESRLLPGEPLVTLLQGPNLPPMKSCVYRMRRLCILCSTNSPTSVKKKHVAEGGPDSTIPFISIYNDHLPCQGAISKHAQKIGVLIPTRHLYGKANCRNCRTKTCQNKDATSRLG